MLPSWAHGHHGGAARSGKLDDLQKLVALCKRRGFVFASAEIYGGFANTYDYGPLGTLLKNNVRDAWIRANVQRRDDMELLDAALITSPRVWVASGHVKEFNDPLVQCLGECKNRYRADQIDGTKCPNCGGTAERAAHVQHHVQDAGRARRRRRTTSPICRPKQRRACSSTLPTWPRRCGARLPFGIAQVRKVVQERNHTG